MDLVSQDDLPVDPNEPTYCICNRVSYGEMVGCDNPSCDHGKLASSSGAAYPA